jgi:hypothetical protein
MREVLCGLALLGCASLASGQASINTVGVWDGAEFIFPWGNTGIGAGTTTYGQSFQTPDAVNRKLTDVTFMINSGGFATDYTAHLYEWDGDSQTGASLYDSGVLTTAGTNSFVAETVSGINAVLDAAKTYVFYFSAIDGNGAATWGFIAANPYGGGDFEFDNNLNQAELFDPWDSFILGDTAFIANFDPAGGGPANAGYYTDGNTASTDPEAGLIANGLVPEQITTLTGHDLSGLEVLVINESLNGFPTNDVINALPAISSWVQGGGKLIVHDRYVSGGGLENNPYFVGAPGMLAMNDFSNDADIDIQTPGTDVTNGSFGTLDDLSLDGGTSSSHGFVDANTLPTQQSVAILERGGAPSEIVSLAYTHGSGEVFYSTIPLDYYLAGNGPNPPLSNMVNIYYPNVIEYMLGFEGGGGGQLYCNGEAPDYANGNEMTQWAQAEDFTGVTGDIGSVHFSALDINNNGLANWDGTVQYAIYLGDPNNANVVASGDGQNVTAAFDQNNGSWDFYDFDFDLASPVSVTGGNTYYLALHLGADFVFDGIYWSTQAANGTASGTESNGGFGGPWNANGLEHYFCLIGAGDQDCIGDCNGDGALNILDFVCFQGEWQNQTPKGDCDGNGLYNILDFVCFQTEWQAGCP